MKNKEEIFKRSVLNRIFCIPFILSLSRYFLNFLDSDRTESKNLDDKVRKLNGRTQILQTFVEDL